MTRSVTKPYSAAVSTHAMDIVTPFASRSLFWRPRYLEPAEILYHVPFVFWLNEMLQPACVVHLGMGGGTGYFAVCQGIEKLGLEARCYGLSCYDATPADPARMQAIAEHNNSHYGDFSRLITGDPGPVRKRLEAVAINLLIVDEPLGARGMEALEADWLPMMAEDGVLLLNGVHMRQTTSVARGVVDRLLDGKPTIELDCGSGLLAILMGEEPVERLNRMAQLQPGEAGYSDVHRVFRRLGTALYQEAEARTRSQAVDAERARAEQAGRDLHVARQTNARLQEDLEQQRALLAARTQERDAAQTSLESDRLRQSEAKAQHQAELQAQKTELTELQADQAHAGQELAELRGQVDRLQDECAALQDLLQTMQGERDTALEQARQTEQMLRQTRAEHQAMAADVLRLQGVEATLSETLDRADDRAAQALRQLTEHCEQATSRAEEYRRHLGKARWQLTRRFEELAELTRMQEVSRVTIQQLQSEMDAMRASSSWRVTAPVRRLRHMAVGKKQPVTGKSE